MDCMAGQRDGSLSAGDNAGMKTLFVIVALAALAACHQEGPAEKAGRQVDDAGKAASRSVEKAGDAIRDAAKGKN
jgi:predicted small lipoprotein YifL